MSKQSGTILIVDDEEDILLTLRMFLKQHFERVFAEQNPQHLPRLLQQYEPDLVLLDMNFRKGDTTGEEGIVWLEKIRTLRPETKVVMITAHGEVEIAVRAIKSGAADFVEKPWRNEKLLATVQAALRLVATERQVKQLETENKSLVEQLELASSSEIVGAAAPMLSIFKTIEKVAATDANVLLTGENGTGKELAARALHRRSPRAEKIFVHVDLGAIPETLFESELFGHVKGAFTDAREDRAGRFEAANGGTLFLDEIGNLTLPLQAKLLSALQNRSVVRVGSHRPIPVDIRLVAATNMDLKQMVAEKTFRQDLLFRINTIEITLPPLRDRPGDVRLLAEHYLKFYAKKYRKTGLTLPHETLKKLETYHWPGNVRELRHSVERAVILAEDKKLSPDDFLLHPEAQARNLASLDTLNLEDVEKMLVEKALAQHQGNISRAADALGLTRAALYRRMEKFGL